MTRAGAPPWARRDEPVDAVRAAPGAVAPGEPGTRAVRDGEPSTGAREARAAIDVRGLSVAFDGERGRAPTTVLDDVDLRVAPGEFVALLGPSGCGKSTLLRVLAGLPSPGARVGCDALVLPARRPDGGPSVAWMPQRDGLLPWRRALANAVLGAVVARRDVPTARARAAELFGTFGLAGFERAWPHELSGGMRQRLALLRTCLAGADVLLLDEPFGALDPITRRRMNAWLAELDLASLGGAGAGAPGASGAPDAGRATVVLVTHDVDEAVLLADRVVVLSPRPGRVVVDVAVAATGRDGLRQRLLDALDLG